MNDPEKALGIVTRLDFVVEQCDGGQYSEAFEVGNILKDDNSVYCSKEQSNINILLAHAKPFCLNGVQIRIPSAGFTAPLKDGLLFALFEPKSFDSVVSDLSMFDKSFFTQKSEGIYFKHLSRIPSYVKACLFFHLDKHSPFFQYRFKKVALPVTHIYFKLLSSHDSQENIDVSFTGILGSDHGQCFYEGSQT